MVMKKRYVKRLIRKIAIFVAAIVTLSLITTSIVERRMKKVEPESEQVTDMNGDPATEPFQQRDSKLQTPRQPRPPVQHRHRPPLWQHDYADDFNMDLAALAAASDTEFQLPMPRGSKKDWHDYAAMEVDRLRVGLGEHGAPAYLELLSDEIKQLQSNMSLENGFNAMLSDSISVNRSLPDVRKEGCRKKEYLASLPTISVVIPCHEEHFSVLLRTLYSIVNRSPRELLHEIIVIDDGSTRETMKKQLDDFVAENFANIVKIIRLPERRGLIGARAAGAKQATGDVLIFFDSHIECNYNWLPPLLEPIAINRRIATCPIVDTIDHANFGYGGGYQEGSRGAFDWKLLYKQLPLMPGDRLDDTLPHRNPIMMGGLFAIGRDFFWELGGYDEELDIWGGEQFELSFKIWMCGGMLLDVPCSRVAHIFRGPWVSKPSPRNYNFMARNLKRVAEVWMDEYKEYFYMRSPGVYEAIDAGDLSGQKALRTHLKCKTFKWFLETIAPDLLAKFPPIEPPDYANGALQNVAHSSYCLDTLGGAGNAAVGIWQCAENKTHPQENQHWYLTAARDIRNFKKDVCLDVQDSHANAAVWMWPCHNLGGNQFWYYDYESQLLKHGKYGEKCLEAIVEDDKTTVVTNQCDKSNERMKWIFANVNQTALQTFFEGLN